MDKSDPDYHRFYGNEGEWCNTLFPEERGENPTVNTITTHHYSDVLGRTRSYHCFVSHVRGFHGKGFMGCVRFTGHPLGTMANLSVFYGVGIEVFNKAKEQAVTQMCDMQTELEESFV